MTTYLRFPDEPTFLLALPAGLEAGPGPELTTDTFVVSVMGTIWEGPEEARVALPGWHVNLRGALPEGWESFVIPAPNSPTRIFG